MIPREVGGDKANIGQDERALTGGAQTLHNRRVQVSVEVLRDAAVHAEGSGDEPDDVTIGVLHYWPDGFIPPTVEQQQCNQALVAAVEVADANGTLAGGRWSCVV